MSIDELVKLCTSLNDCEFKAHLQQHKFNIIDCVDFLANSINSLKDKAHNQQRCQELDQLILHANELIKESPSEVTTLRHLVKTYKFVFITVQTEKVFQEYFKLPINSQQYLELINALFCSNFCFTTLLRYELNTISKFIEQLPEHTDIIIPGEVEKAQLGYKKVIQQGQKELLKSLTSLADAELADRSSLIQNESALRSSLTYKANYELQRLTSLISEELANRIHITQNESTLRFKLTEEAHHTVRTLMTAKHERNILNHAESEQRFDLEDEEAKTRHALKKVALSKLDNILNPKASSQHTTKRLNGFIYSPVKSHSFNSPTTLHAESSVSPMSTSSPLMAKYYESRKV